MKCVATPRVLLSYRNRSWSVIGALSELIDNSFGEDRGNAGIVQVFWDKKRRSLAVLDNGRGMTAVSYLFVIGQGAGETGGNDIGRYGSGGSNALLWLSDIVEIWTVNEFGQRAYTQQNIQELVEVKEEWPDVDDTWSRVTARNVPLKMKEVGQGTLILMRVSKRHNVRPNNLRRDLSKRYAPALRSGRQIVWHDEDGSTSLTPWNPGELGDSVSVELKVRGLEAGFRVAYAEEVSQGDAGISISYGLREIEFTTDPFGEYVGGQVYGYIDLRPEWKPWLTTTKDGFVDAILRQELIDAAHKEMLWLLEFLENKKTERFEAALKLACFEGISELLKKAVRGKPGSGDHPIKLLPGEGGFEPGPPRPPKDLPKGEIDKEEDEPNGLPIDIRGVSGNTIDGQWMDGKLIVGEKMVISYNKDDETVIEAKNRKPVNMAFFKSLIVDLLLAELYEHNLLVDSGFIDADELEQIEESRKHQHPKTAFLRIVSVLKPRMMAKIKAIA
jgi:hypothetical protein